MVIKNTGVALHSLQRPKAGFAADHDAVQYMATTASGYIDEAVVAQHSLQPFHLRFRAVVKMKIEVSKNGDIATRVCRAGYWFWKVQKECEQLVCLLFLTLISTRPNDV